MGMGVYDPSTGVYGPRAYDALAMNDRVVWL